MLTVPTSLETKTKRSRRTQHWKSSSVYKLALFGIYMADELRGKVLGEQKLLSFVTQKFINLTAQAQIRA